MDFAQKQLQKYGWSKGKGLGREETGIKEALKPKPKHGSHGIGFDISEEFTNEWWHKVYNDAANNINFEANKIDSNLSKNNEITKTKKRKIGSEKKLLYTCNFIKGATLTNGVTEIDLKNEDKSDIVTKNEQSHINRLSDEELFAACGGRTAHKGARHGLKSSGKLSRLKEQEMKYIKLLQTKKLTADNFVILNSKKKLKRK